MFLFLTITALAALTQSEPVSYQQQQYLVPSQLQYQHSYVSQEREGANLDSELLGFIRQVLVQLEQSEEKQREYQDSHTRQYGAKVNYWLPKRNSIVDVEFEGIQQSVPVAQFSQRQVAQGSYHYVPRRFNTQYSVPSTYNYRLPYY